jgi:PelA/Pel-15E family pectate lyase
MTTTSRCGWLAVVASALAVSASAAEPPTRDEAVQALEKAVGFYRTQVARHGGYLWQYSGDLKLAEGEGKVDDAHTVWVQPPGTPTVGLAYLAAYEATGDKDYLAAAREAAGALIAGQLKSGGWTYRITFDPAGRKQAAYRSGGGPKGRNISTLDDDTTQAALRLLVRVDQALDFKDKEVHEAVEYALTALVKNQYPNGAWPQGFDRPPDPDQFPVKKAAYYPGDWPRAPVRKDYWTYYTLNDSCTLDTLEVMALAADVYRDPRYDTAVKKAGDFLLLAQLPDPQPAWAQQYDADMRPAWARKFEPPAVTAGESQRVLESLLWLYARTKEAKYLEPVPRALAYLKASRLPDGRLSRFYELKTNRPLYFTRKYELTHAADDLPTHYGFIVPSRLAAIEAEYDRLKAGRLPREAKPGAAKLAAAAKAAIDRMDARGAWVEKGRLRHHGAEPASGVISSRRFAENVAALCRYVAATR